MPISQSVQNRVELIKKPKLHIHYAKAHEASLEGNYEKAIFYLEKYALACPNKSEPSHLLGNTYSTIGAFVQAAKAYEKAIDNLDQNEEPWVAAILQYNYGNVLAYLQKHKKAVESYKIALKRSELPPRDIHKNIGNSYFSMADYKNAYKHYKHGSDIMQDEDLNLAMGNCKVLQGYFYEALKLYDGKIFLEQNQEFEHCGHNKSLVKEIIEILGKKATPIDRKENIVYFACPAKNMDNDNIRPFRFAGNQGNVGNIPGGRGYDGLKSFTVSIVPQNLKNL